VINEQIISNLEANNLKKLFVFAPDPDKILKNLFRGRKIPKDKIVKIKGYFGTQDGLIQLNRTWFHDYLGNYFTSDNHPLIRTIEWQNKK
jgi:hypothetical protein